MDGDPRNPYHWLSEDYHQKMTTEEWAEIVRNHMDTVFFRGKSRQLIAKSLGIGEFEVSKKFIR